MNCPVETGLPVNSPDLPALLRERLQQPLPGASAHRPFAASLCFGRHRGPALPTTRAAAVLVLLCETEQGWHVPMTLRPMKMAQHAGQICFPGGALEAGEDVEQAALREFQEELGVELSRQQVIGQLTPLWVFASDFWVTPVLASCQDPLLFDANPEEVADVIEVPVTSLLSDAGVEERPVQGRGFEVNAPAFCIGERVIWGASSMVLGDLMVLLKQLPVNKS